MGWPQHPPPLPFPAPLQFTLGVLAAHGLFGEPLDEAAAALHYYFASLGGSLQAQAALGHRHAVGLGVPRSCKTAVLYLTGEGRGV